MEDPFPLYEQIRAVGNVVWNGPLSGWVAVGYDEAASVLTDPGERFAILSGDPELTCWFEAPNMITVGSRVNSAMRSTLSSPRSWWRRWRPATTALTSSPSSPCCRP